jgi:hypothetical protein
MSRSAEARPVRAVYVPAGGESLGVAWLEATATDAAGDWTLLVYTTGSQPPRRTALSAAELREVVRQWGWAARRGRGTLRIG